MKPGPKPTCLCGRCRKCRYRAAKFRHYHRHVKGEANDPAYAHRGKGGRPLGPPAADFRERRAKLTEQQRVRRGKEPRPPAVDDAELDRRAAEWLKGIR